MKRLTSILLALLMLVGMALAEETPDAALGDWYALPSDETVLRLTLREDGTFFFGTEGISGIEGKWRKTTDGEYNLAYTNRSSSLLDVIMSMVDSQAPAPDMTMTARLTESGLDVFYGSTAEGAVVHMARDAEELRTERTPRTDTPLEAFQGVWSAEYARSGSTLTSLGTDENGAPLPFCTVSGTDITLYTITDEVDLTYPATLKDGVLSMSAQEKGQTFIVELFQTEEGGMYATFSVNIVGMSNTLVLELSPVE